MRTIDHRRRRSSVETGAFGFTWQRRLLLSVVIIAVLCCAGAWSYTAYQARRAASMMAEVSRVQIGDNEASVLPIAKRYGGHRWEPQPLSPREDWVDPDEYDRALSIQPDYLYSIQVNPWGLPTLAPSSKAEKTLRTVMNAIPSEIRSPLGLRDWASFAEIHIRDGRVSKVEGTFFVEGRSRWLNHSWDLATEMRNEPPPLRPYTIEGENVLMREGRSRGIRNLITPQASEEQAGAARSWNIACVTSLRGCSNRCDLSPRAFNYWKTHPASATTWKPTCE